MKTPLRFGLRDAFVYLLCRDVVDSPRLIRFNCRNCSNNLCCSNDCSKREIIFQLKAKNYIDFWNEYYRWKSWFSNFPSDSKYTWNAIKYCREPSLSSPEKFKTPRNLFQFIQRLRPMSKFHGKFKTSNDSTCIGEWWKTV